MQTKILIMKNIYRILPVIAVMCGCSALEDGSPYSQTMNTLRVQVAYPDGFGTMLREGITVRVEDSSKGSGYTARTDVKGIADMTVPNGIYRITVSDRSDEYVFNGALSGIRLVDRDLSLTVGLQESKSGDIVWDIPVRQVCDTP